MAVSSELQDDYSSFVKQLTDIKRFTRKVEVEIFDKLKICEVKIGQQNIKQKAFEIERKKIVKVIGLSKGHWFKCANGHYYAIGECGGAMQQSQCIECKVPVGGGSHRLLPGNSLATEIDGATRPAYPTL